MARNKVDKVIVKRVKKLVKKLVKTKTVDGMSRVQNKIDILLSTRNTLKDYEIR